MPPQMVDVMEDAVKQYRLNPKRETEDVVNQCADEIGVTLHFPDTIIRQMILSFIDREASFRLRHELIEATKPFGMSVFGEPFWGKAVGKSFYKGGINYYSGEIAGLYESSTINLNISKYQLKTTVNQRVLTAPYATVFS